MAYLRVDHARVQADQVPQVRCAREIWVVDLAMDGAEPQRCDRGWNDADEAVPVHLADAKYREGAYRRTVGEDLVDEGDWPCAGVVREVVLFDAACWPDPELVNERLESNGARGDFICSVHHGAGEACDGSRGGEGDVAIE